MRTPFAQPKSYYIADSPGTFAAGIPAQGQGTLDFESAINSFETSINFD